MIKKIKQSIKKFLLLIILVSASFNILSDEITLVVSGIGDSKAAATIDAQRNALRASYGEFISNNLTTLDNELTKNETVNLVSGTIQDSKVLSESKDDFSVPPIIEVLVEITVNRGKLVSFAKAIGDNVEIQGSLFGAEIRQQEINKNNELTAMEHLAKKAETMATFFDYEMTVQSPKRSPVIQDDYFIYSSMSLITNQNYRNLTSTVLDTISQVAMKSDEIEKYNELGTPFYRLDVINIQNPICYRLDALGLIEDMWDNYNEYNEEALKDPGPNLRKLMKAGDPEMTIMSYDPKTLEQIRYALENNDYEGYWKNRKDKSNISKQRGVTISKGIRDYVYITCNAGRVDRFYLRSKDSYRNFEKIRQQIEKSIVGYEVSRKTRTDSKLIFPFSFTNPSRAEIGNPDFAYLEDGPEKYLFDKKSLMLKERILERQTQEDKNKVSNECTDELWPMGEIDICYEDTDYTEFAKDVTRIYDSSDYSPTLRVGYYEAGGFFSDPEFFSPLSKEDLNSICQSRTIQAEYSKEEAEDFCEKDNSPSKERRRSRPVIHNGMLSRQSPVFLYYEDRFGVDNIFGSFFIFPQDHKFSVLNFEDVVDTQKLSTITGYEVDPDNLTKR